MMAGTQGRVVVAVWLITEVSSIIHHGFADKAISLIPKLGVS